MNKQAALECQRCRADTLLDINNGEGDVVCGALSHNATASFLSRTSVTKNPPQGRGFKRVLGMLT